MVASLLVLAILQTPPSSLTETTFPAIRAYASPTEKDLAFQQIDWQTSIYDGITKSQAEDKPMLMWMYFGDPRGKC